MNSLKLLRAIKYKLTLFRAIDQDRLTLFRAIKKRTSLQRAQNKHKTVLLRQLYSVTSRSSDYLTMKGNFVFLLK